MPSSIPDAAERRQALDPSRSFIVQAPAGSGKTELLTQRYLSLLARAAAPEEIVAITFTNKAAGEMRNRILAALDKAAQEEQPPDAAHERQTWELGRAALARDRERQWELRNTPSRLRVQTFDALCAWLVQQMPLLSGFGAAVGIHDEPKELYRQAAQATLRELESGEVWSDSIARLLEHLDNHGQILEDLLSDMLARRDHWLRHLGRMKRTGLEAALRRLVEENLARLDALLPAWLKAEAPELMAFAAENLAEKPSLNGFPRAVAEFLADWQALADFLLTDQGEWRKAVNKTQGFPPADKKNPDAARCKAMKDRMSAILGDLRESGLDSAELARARELPQARYSDRQWEVLQALMQVLHLAAAQLELVFRETGQVDFMSRSQAAQRALGTPEAPTDLALALDYRIRHLLIDEFQDTSLSQFELLKTLIAGWQPDDGRTLFAVGDPMQSIYRFREAEVGLFLRARQSGIGDVPLVPLTLTVNFRSQGKIVEWVNQSFSQILPQREDLASGAVCYSASDAFHPPLDGPAVTLLPQTGRDDEAEAQQAASLIRAALEQGDSVAVLVRSRSHLQTLVPALRRAGLRFAAVEIEKLGERQVVRDLHALARALLHPGDRVAWLGVLRAPWCGLTLADLHALAGDAPQAAIWSLIGDEARVSALSPDGQARLRGVRDILQEKLKHRRRQPLRVWLEQTWLALGGAACVEDLPALEDARRFFSLLESLETGGGLTDFTRLARKLTELYAAPDVGANKRLQIMTIHKAKGLEFDQVILPGLGRKPRGESARLLLWLERPRAHGGNDLLLAPIKASEDAEQDPIYAGLAALDRHKGVYEEQRLLYVAATRAKKHLYLMGHAGVKKAEAEAKPEAGSLLARLWPAVSASFAAGMNPDATDAADANPPEQPQSPLHTRFAPGWQPPPLPVAPPLKPQGAAESVKEEELEPVFHWAGETARHLGSVLHQALQRFTLQGVIECDSERLAALRRFSRLQLKRLGVPQAHLENAAQRVEQAVLSTLGDARGRWIMQPDHADAACEYPLSGVYRGHVVNVVIDRTFVDKDGIRWIIDYKTGLHEGGKLEEFLDREQARYTPQLERYAALMRLRETRPIHLGLYFPLLQGWRGWAWGAF